MKQNYDICLSRVLRDEGGYTNDPSDRGGPTNFGITIFDYRKYIDSKGTAEDVRNMSVNQAKTIYRSKYWDSLGCDNLASGVDYTCFDYGVNSGLERPRKALQRFKSLGVSELIDAINNERTAFLQALGSRPSQKKFLSGWLRRVNHVKMFSHELANKKDNTTGPATAAAVGGLGYVLSQFWHSHEIPIVIGGVAIAILVGTIIHYLRNKNG